MYQAIIEYPVPPSITKELESLQEQIKNLEHYQIQLRAYTRFAAEVLAKTPGEFKPIWQNFVGSTALCLFIKVPGFTSEAAPGLSAFLEFLSDFYENPPTSHDNPEGNQRVYYFTPVDPDTALSIRVFAELEENAENCQRIITGVRKEKKYQLVEIESPVYAFKC